VVAIYCDSGSLDDIKKYAKNGRVSGFTTNPSLMRKAGISSYREFADAALIACGTRAISFEVLAGDSEGILKQAAKISSWGENVYVKIPITDTKGEIQRSLIHDLRRLNLNITAVMTYKQIEEIHNVLQPHHILSVFNGRIQDTQKSPLDVRYFGAKFKFLWASTRMVGSVSEAERLGYDIITMTPDLIEKLPLHGKDLTQYSLETVRQFVKDGEGIQF
jgi:transaldolase